MSQLPPICALDTEATGVHHDRQVYEVAMIRRDGEYNAEGGVAIEREITFFVDVDLSYADPFGLKVGRFYERHPLGRFLSSTNELDSQSRSPWGGARTFPDTVTPRRAAELVAQWTHGAHIVGAVPNFDTEMLGILLRQEDLTPAWHYHLCDIEALAVGYLAARDDFVVTLPWKSDELSRMVGVEPPTDEERHTALGDARHALRVYDAITADATVRGLK